MPLYKIVHADETRLVKAVSAASALRHVTASMFAVIAVTDPSEAAEIVGGGIKLEVAGDGVSDAVATVQTPEAEATREMLAGLLAPKPNAAAKAAK